MHSLPPPPLPIRKRLPGTSAPFLAAGLPATGDRQPESTTSAEGLSQALRQSELSYRRLFEAAQDGILILDANTGRINDANPYLLELLGFTLAEVVGKTVGDLSPFKDIISNQIMLQRLKESGYVRHDNLPLQTRDGRKIAVEFVSNVYDSGDREVIQCNIRDITERTQTEQRLVLLSACVRNLNDVFMVTEATPIDEPGPQIVFVNEAFERNTGYAATEAMGRSPRMLQGAMTNRKVLAEIREALSACRPIRRQMINYRKDGTTFWLDIDITPIFNPAGTCTHFAAIERDITDIKKSEARLRRLVDSTAQNVVFWNAKGEISDANESFLKLMHISRADLDKGGISWLAMTPPEHAHLDLHAADEMAAKGACNPYEKELIRQDGSRIPILLGAAVFEDDPGEGVGFILDLTERKKLEHQFLRAQRMESIGTLAGGIAHDLNNILAPIMMSIDMLQTMSFDPRAKKVLATIELSARRGADIVRQVLSFARGVEGQRIEIQPKHVLRELENIIRDTFPRDIHLDFTMGDEIWAILGDLTQIHQILLNLCVNARDAMPDGGTLTIASENCLLDEQAAAMNLLKAGRYVRISVTDSGTGIPPNLIDKIFDPFFTTKDKNKGTGLGLSTVLGIVKSHGGAVNAYSEHGKGSTFKVYLPALGRSSVPPQSNGEDEGPPRGNGELILVVDDEAAILMITSHTLQAFGFRVLTATDGADAVAIYAQHKAEIAVVLTDMMMPIMNGQAAMLALRRINPEVKIIAASGLNTTGGMTGSNISPAKNFLLKPYSAGTLIQAIRTALAEA